MSLQVVYFLQRETLIRALLFFWVIFTGAVKALPSQTLCDADTFLIDSPRTDQDSDTIVDARWFGIKLDGVTDNSIPFLSAAKYCIKHDKKLVVPNGSIVLKAQTYDLLNESSLTIEFRGTKIIRRQNSVVKNFSPLFNIRASNVSAKKVQISGGYFDGNRRNQDQVLWAADLGNPYAYEQSACIKVFGIGTGSVRLVEVKDCHFYDPVADNIMIGPSSTKISVQQAEISNCMFENRNGVRSDIALGSSVANVYVYNCLGVDNGSRASRIESEYSKIGKQKTKIHISQTRMGTLELGGRSNKQSTAIIENSAFNYSCILSGVTAFLNNSTIRVLPAKVGGSWSQPIVTMQGGKVLIPYDGINTFKLMFLFNKGFDCIGDFESVIFRYDSDSTKLVLNDYMIDMPVAKPMSGETILLRLKNCKFDERASKVVDVGGWSCFESYGNEYWAVDHAIRALGNSTGEAACSFISDNDILKGVGGTMYHFGASSAKYYLEGELSGAYNADEFPPDLISQTGTSWITDGHVHSKRVFYSCNPPTGGGIQGDSYFVGNEKYVATVNSLTNAKWRLEVEDHRDP